jgi:hypothetical protein
VFFIFRNFLDSKFLTGFNRVEFLVKFRNLDKASDFAGFILTRSNTGFGF